MTRTPSCTRSNRPRQRQLPACVTHRYRAPTRQPARPQPTRSDSTIAEQGRNAREAAGPRRYSPRGAHQNQGQRRYGCLRSAGDGIHRTDGYPQPLPADPAAFVTPSYETVAWVAESDGRIIGHVALHHPALDPTLQVAQHVTGLSPNRLALVARLLVDPTRRRLGVGRQLLAAATGHAASLGQRAVLDVFRDAGGPIALYEAAGWIRVDALTLAADDGTSLELWVYLAPTDGHR